jgi:hypothetical protein
MRRGNSICKSPTVITRLQEIPELLKADQQAA